MDGDVVIRVEGLGKRYTLGARSNGQYTALRDVIAGSARGLLRRVRPVAVPTEAAATDFWALRDVSFEARRGEVVGIIGRNGAGKSTLLKVLSRITEPTHGRITLRGRVASLLEVGTGFHPELTGRENIFLNGAILGMHRSEIKAKFDEIVAFAEVERFLDTPVKRYSSGMYVRLAFAVAAHLEPEILIVDEVLAVGDAEFQKKCLGKMKDVSQGEGRTVLFVSHNIAAIQQLCTKGLLLEKGRGLCSGAVAACVERYVQNPELASATEWRRPADAPAGAPLRYEALTLGFEGGEPGTGLTLRAVLRSTAVHPPAFVAFDISTPAGVVVMQALPTLETFISSDDPTHHLQVRIDLAGLIPGAYLIGAWTGPHFASTFDEVPACLRFEIDTSPTAGRSFPHGADHGYLVPASHVSVVASLP